MTFPASFSIDGIPPVHITRTIYQLYFKVLLQLADQYDIDLVPSLNSCYRSYAYEIKRGRSGSSLHTFPAGTGGACDLVRSTGPIDQDALHMLKLHSPFRRIAYYPNNGFVHVDYGMPGMPLHVRQFFTCASPKSPWKYQGDLADNRDQWQWVHTKLDANGL